MKTIRFGIIGTGTIAVKFAQACAMTEGVCAHAVSSRTLDKAQQFASKNGITKAYGSYEEMMLDADIDAVYVATPHTLHYENCMLALKNGKHVLCEKPLVTKKEDAEKLWAFAKERSLFIMEGMWTRFLPNTQKVKQWLDDGCIGKLKFIDAIFSFAVDMNNLKDRLVNPALGGGAVYDLGVYTVEMASYYAGANPIAYSSFGTDFCPGTDATAVMAVKYPNDILATLRMGIVCNAPGMATLLGTKGRIEIPQFHLANTVRLVIDNEVVETFTQEYETSEGFTWQLKQVCEYLRAGITESPIMPMSDSIATAGILEGTMRQFYPDQSV